jgi:radical SAM superfamily enzyme YgiQ (UPF0313 family)
MQKDFIILSVPYCEPLPMVAPVLLAGCLESADISARGIDLNADFLKEFANQDWFVEYKNFLQMGGIMQPTFDKKIYKILMRWTKNYLLDVKQKYNPKYIGLSIFTSESLDFGLLLSYQIRKYLPDVILIAGGKGLETTVSVGKKHYEDWMENCVVDSIIVGDAESAIIDLVKNNLSGIVYAKQQTKEDLDNIPIAKWDDYDMSIYASLSKLVDRHQLSYTDAEFSVDEPYLAVNASKGCVRQCTFCDVGNFWPDYIYRDPVKVANEIIHNYKKTGIKKFRFTDNLINGSISNFRIMNQILAEQVPNQIIYGGYAIFRGKNEMPEKDFELAARAGNNIWMVGVESGSERVRYELKKKFDNSDLDWSVRMLYKYGISQNWLLMVGWPSETERDFQDTVDLLLKYQHLKSHIRIQVTPTFSVLNNSPLLTKPELAHMYGLTHLNETLLPNNKFWESTKYLDNTFPVRSARWKKLVQTAEECGYQFGQGMPVQKWHEEIKNLDKVYAEQKRKIIPVFRTS